MEQTINTKDKIKKILQKKYAWTIIDAIIITIYLIVLNVVYRIINPTLIIKCSEIFSILTLSISIILMEKAYKENGKNSLCAIEFLILSIYLLLMNHVIQIYNYETQEYIDLGTVLAISYYFLKMAIIYTKEHKEQLNSLSDIKQIIKEEPIKKEAKRKNVKN